MVKSLATSGQTAAGTTGAEDGKVSILNGARITLGVSGGIAAYKAVDLASKLVQGGATVDVILTRSATEFIQPLTFQAITKQPVHTGVFEGWTEHWYGHISLAHASQALLIAPATANTIAKLANGLADDMLGSVALSLTAPLIIAPAMEHQMWHHPATQANLATLRNRGATIVGPETGRLASGEFGDGRLVQPEMILGALRQVLGQNGPLAGRKIVVTAGGTHEPLDPVRFLGNRSSGLMGYRLAEAAIDQGAAVTLISGPTLLKPPYSARFIGVETADQMHGAVREECEDADVLIMAAAVADYRPAAARSSKIKKGDPNEPAAIELVRNPDILASIDVPDLLKVGFAAETEDLIANAQDKLRRKGLAMIVANDAVKTIGSDRSSATIVLPYGEPHTLPMMEKAEVADAILERIAWLLNERRA
jgi:phosphopantothenoylcysteine decarboxylase/phosphopantothenate--cysteine ligase